MIFDHSLEHRKRIFKKKAAYFFIKKLKRLTAQAEDTMLFIILILSLIMAHVLSKKHLGPHFKQPLTQSFLPPFTEVECDTLLSTKPTTAREAYEDYNYKYSNPDGSRRYNRAAFRLVNDAPVFLSNNTCVSAYISADDLEKLSNDTEVFAMVVVASSLYGYLSHENKQAKNTITLAFRAEAIREIGIWGRGFGSSWRVDGENFHVLDAGYMRIDQIENFKEHTVEDYEFNSTY